MEVEKVAILSVAAVVISGVIALAADSMHKSERERALQTCTARTGSGEIRVKCAHAIYGAGINIEGRAQ